MRHLTNLLQFVKTNDIQGLEQYCKDLLQFNSFQSKDAWTVINYTETANQLILTCAEHAADELHLISRLYLSKPNAEAIESAILTAVKLKKWNQVNALLDLGAQFEFKTEHRESAVHHDLHAHIQWRAAVAKAKEPVGFFKQLLSSKQSTIQELFLIINQCAAFSHEIFADRINAITSQNIINPFTLPEWELLVEAVKKCSHAETKSIHTENFAAYHHPKSLLATKESLTAEQKNQIDRKAHDLIRALKAKAHIGDVNHDDDNADAVNPADPALLSWYFTTPENIITREERIKSERIQQFLFDHDCQFDFYIHNIQQAFTQNDSSTELTQAAIQHFRQACAEKIKQHSLEPFHKTVVAETPKPFPGFSQYAGCISLADYWKNTIFTNPENAITVLVALTLSDAEMAKVALDECDVNIKYKDQPLLIWAAEKHLDHLVAYLLQNKNLDINAQDKNGDTYLTWAISKDYTELVPKILSINKINIHICNHKRLSALHLAINNKQFETVACLLDVEGTNLQNDNTALFFAIATGDLRFVRAVVAKGANINTKNGQSPLMQALTMKHVDIAEFLLDQKDIILEIEAVFLAVENRFDKIIDKMLAFKNYNLNAVNKNNKTLLYKAVLANNLGLVKKLVAIPEVNLYPFAHIEVCPLRLAATNNNNDIFNALMERNDLRFYSALSPAVRNKNLDMIKKMVARSTGVESEQHFVAQAIAEAFESNQPDFVCELLNAKNVLNALTTYRNEVKTSFNLLESAARTGSIKIVEKLIALGVLNLNWRDFDGATALMTSACYGHLAIVQLLLRHGLKANSIDFNRRTPLIYAARGGHVDVIRELLAQPHNEVNAVDSLGSTALCDAVIFNHVTAVAALLSSNKIDVNQSTHSAKWTPLMDAVSRKHIGVINTLLQDARTDLSRQNSNGETVLMMAARSSSLDVVKKLLPGSPLQTISSSGETVLHFAACNEDPEVMQLFLNRSELDVNARDKNQNTALSNAVIIGRVAVVKRLLSVPGIDITLDVGKNYIINDEIKALLASFTPPKVVAPVPPAPVASAPVQPKVESKVLFGDLVSAYQSSAATNSNVVPPRPIEKLSPVITEAAENLIATAVQNEFINALSDLVINAAERENILGLCVLKMSADPNEFALQQKKKLNARKFLKEKDSKLAAFFDEPTVLCRGVEKAVILEYLATYLIVNIDRLIAEHCKKEVVASVSVAPKVVMFPAVPEGELLAPLVPPQEPRPQRADRILE